MNKEEIKKVINYNYAEFGNEFGDAIVDLKNELDKSNEKLEKIKEDIEHELNGHIIPKDEESWNPEFYTKGKLDYRKLCIYLLSDVLEIIKGK